MGLLHLFIFNIQQCGLTSDHYSTCQHMVAIHRSKWQYMLMVILGSRSTYKHFQNRFRAVVCDIQSQPRVDIQGLNASTSRHCGDRDHVSVVRGVLTTMCWYFAGIWSGDRWNLDGNRDCVLAFRAVIGTVCWHFEW